MKDQSRTSWHIGEHDIVFFDTNFIAEKIEIGKLQHLIKGIIKFFSVRPHHIVVSSFVLREYKVPLHLKAKKNKRTKKDSPAKEEVEWPLNSCLILRSEESIFQRTLDDLEYRKGGFASAQKNEKVGRDFVDVLIYNHLLYVLYSRFVKGRKIHFLCDDIKQVNRCKAIFEKEGTTNETDKIFVVSKEELKNSPQADKWEKIWQEKYEYNIEECSFQGNTEEIIKDFCTIVKNDDNSIVRTAYLLVPDILHIKRLLKEIERVAEKIDWGLKREEARTLFEFCFKNFDEARLQGDLPPLFRAHHIKEFLNGLVEKAIWYRMRILMGDIVQAFKEHLPKDRFLENLNTQKGSFSGSIVERIFVGRYGRSPSFNTEKDENGKDIKCVEQTDNGQQTEGSVLEILDALIRLYKENVCSRNQKYHLLKIISDARYADSLYYEGKSVEAQENILAFYKDIFAQSEFSAKHRIKEEVSDKKLTALSEKRQSIAAIIEKDIWLKRYETLFTDRSWKDNTQKAIEKYVEAISSKEDWARWKEKLTIWWSEERRNRESMRLFLTLMGERQPNLIYDDLVSNNYYYLNCNINDLPIFLGYLVRGLLSTSDQDKRGRTKQLAKEWIANHLPDSDKVIAIISALGVYDTKIDTKTILDELEEIWEEHKEAQNYTFVEALLEGISFVNAAKEGHEKRQSDLFMKVMMGSNDAIISRLTKDRFFNACSVSKRMCDSLLYGLENDQEKAAWVLKTFLEHVREIALQHDTYNNDNIDDFFEKLLEKGFIEEVLEFISAYDDDRRRFRKEGIYKGISEFNILSHIRAEQSDKLLHMFLQWKKEDKNIPFDYIFHSTSKSFTDRLVEFVKKEQGEAFSLSLDVLKTMRKDRIDGCDSTLVQNIIKAYSGDITQDQDKTLLYCLEPSYIVGEEDISKSYSEVMQEKVTETLKEWSKHPDSKVSAFANRCLKEGL